MPTQHSSAALAPGRSPGRLRSKTSDLSDILHGRTSSSRPSDADVPPLPTPSIATSATPTKPKGKLAGFLARKRKSGGIALSGGHDASVREDEGTDTENYPAIPQTLAARSVTSSLLSFYTLQPICSLFPLSQLRCNSILLLSVLWMNGRCHLDTSI